MSTAALGAWAQNSVVLSGTMDMGYNRYRSDGSGSVNKFNSGNLSTSKLIIRGTEDLGGGLGAGFWLEAGIFADDGEGYATNTNNTPSGTGLPSAGRQGLTFNRRATVSLMGPWGEVRLGRDYAPTFWNQGVFDPFGTLGAAQATNLILGNTTSTSVRASNTIGYFTPGCSTTVCKGFYGQVMYAAGEQLSSSLHPDDGNYFGGRVGYAAGPFNVAIAAGRTDNDVQGDFKQWNVGGSYDFGAAKLLALAGVNSNGVRGAATAGATRLRYEMIGATIPVSVHEVRLSYTQAKYDNAAGTGARQLGLGYVHNLSKRTALYATASRLVNRNGVAGGPAFTISGAPAVTQIDGSSTGFDLGLRHHF
jgi:predicted porin